MVLGEKRLAWSSKVGETLNLGLASLEERGLHKDRDRERTHVTRKAKTGMMNLQAKHTRDCWQTTEM